MQVISYIKAHWRELLLGVAVLAVLTLAILLARTYRKTQAVEVTTDTVVYVDTVRYIEPIARDSVVVRYERVRLPVATEASTHDTLYMSVVDSVEVEVPITQKMYADSTYTAWVSGYNARLDSITVMQRREVITRTITHKQRWGVGVIAGYGYGAHGLSPYIGVGVSYNLWGW